MRKLFYILILVTFLELFSPVSISAQLTNQLGTCRYTSAGITKTNTSITYTNCKALDAAASWTANPTTPNPPAPPSTPTTTYTLLAPLPCDNSSPDCQNGQFTTFDPTAENNLSRYLNIMLRIFIGICAVLAVIMIIAGGLEYMTSEFIGEKAAGKNKITNAIFGLILALSAWTILHQINPALLDADLASLTSVTVEVAADANSAIIKPANSANCKVAPPTSACSPDKLAVFGNQQENASKICNVESGGNAAQLSTGDRCMNGGPPFSFGLFQINLVANGAIVKNANGESCGGLFEKVDGSAIDKNYIVKGADGRVSYNCKVKAGQEQRMASCSVALLNPTENIRVAKTLFDQNRFGAWYYSDRQACAEAFK